MNRFAYYGLIGGLVVISYLFANGLAGLLVATAAPVGQETLHKQKIYAYRDWQSTGVQLHANETVAITAEGEWLYTPGEYHGPEGHPRYPAPDFYPIPGVAGGVLIGKIGESGTPFVVARNSWNASYDGWDASAGRYAEGLLYLRINDDILSDNRGAVAVDVSVQAVDERSTMP
jgi:hypothetical protein